MSRNPILASATAVAATYTTLQVLGRRAGSSAPERAAQLPGDELVQDPQMVMNHGVTIEARAEEIWPWLTQMGWHLGGYYTPHRVDKLLFPENWECLARLDPQLVRNLRIGDVIPDGKPGTVYFRVALVERPNLLVLKSQTHLPPGWGEKYGARITWTWTVHLTELPEASTRVHLRVRGHMSPWWLTALYVATHHPRGLRHGHRDVEGPEESCRTTGHTAPVGPGTASSGAVPHQDERGDHLSVTVGPAVSGSGTRPTPRHTSSHHEPPHHRRPAFFPALFPSREGGGHPCGTWTCPSTRCSWARWASSRSRRGGCTRRA